LNLTRTKIKQERNRGAEKESESGEVLLAVRLSGPKKMGWH